jgi:hypothetical protein
MTTAAERDAHDHLRDTIRATSLAMWDRRLSNAEHDEERDTLTETRPEVEGGLLVDYVVVAVFDSGSDDHTVTAVLRTDGQCAQHRTVGLLRQGLADVLG